MRSKVAKIFTHAGHQAVRLPNSFRFDGDEVYIRRDPRNGDVILSMRAELSWMEFVVQRHSLGALPVDFLADRVQGTQRRDALEGWVE